MTEPESVNQQENTAEDAGHGLSAGQLMGVLQLGIFLPFLGPLLMIVIGAMHRQSKDARMLMWGGVGLTFLQLATLALIYGYVVSHRLPSTDISY